MLKNRKVTHFKLPKTLYVPGLVELKPTLSKDFYPSLEMELCFAGVLCTLIHNGSKRSFIIPYAPDQCIVLADSDEKDVENAQAA